MFENLTPYQQEIWDRVKDDERSLLEIMDELNFVIARFNQRLIDKGADQLLRVTVEHEWVDREVTQ